MTVFLRIIEPPVDEKPAALLRAIHALRSGKSQAGSPQVVFERATATFAAVPGAPFAYWVSEAIRDVFGRLERLEANGRTVKQGLATRNDFRFVRTWWEIQRGRESTWPLFAKGGAFASFYCDVTLAVRWDAEAQASYAERTSNFNVLLTSSRDEFLYRAGLTWPRRTNGLSFRVLPRGCVFADKGPVAFVDGDDPSHLTALAAVVNSAPFGYLMAVQLARTELAQSYEVGLVQQTPVPALDDAVTELARLARRVWSLKRSIDSANETSHAFLLPSDLNENVTGLDRGEIERELESLRRQIDEAAFALYRIGAEDRAAIEASSKRANFTDEAAEVECDDEGDDLSEDGVCVAAPANAALSWLVGIAFGRFDPRLATRERPIPTEPEPFEPLPSRSPGMWPEGEGRDDLLPDILVDDSGHSGDIRAHVANAAAKTGLPDPHDLRRWLAREFFASHIKMYSKSRRKAPIYWQLATPSASYSVWLYIHALTEDTLFRVQNDYVAPKLAHEERRLELARREGGFSADTDPRPYEEQRLDLVAKDLGVQTEGAKPAAAARKELAAQEAFVEELRAFFAEVKLVTPLWTPYLDDGVVINAAPLWRLFPQHKAWKKELLGVWRSLCNGEYDWSHMAMRLWPERVVPKCADDRSLAIAHGLEDVFWIEGASGKRIKREKPTAAVDALVKERTSSAVKAALTKLLDAPQAGGPTRPAATRGARSSKRGDA